MDPSVSCLEGVAFEEGLVALYPRLLPLALRLCRNQADAHDLVQDTVERGLRCRRLFRTGDTPDRWMSTILRRIFLDRCRRVRRGLGVMALEEGPARAATRPEPEEPSSWEAFSVDDVRRALLFVDTASRETFLLFAFGNLDQMEIAQRLAISRKTVATRVFRTRRKLRKILASGEHLHHLALVPPLADGGVTAPRPAVNAVPPRRSVPATADRVLRRAGGSR